MTTKLLPFNLEYAKRGANFLLKDKDGRLHDCGMLEPTFDRFYVSCFPFHPFPFESVTSMFDGHLFMAQEEIDKVANDPDWYARHIASIYGYGRDNFPELGKLGSPVERDGSKSNLVDSMVAACNDYSNNDDMNISELSSRITKLIEGKQ